MNAVHSSMAGFAGAAGVAAATAAYLDAKYSISKDLRFRKIMETGSKMAVKAAAEKRQSLWYLFEATANKYPTARMIWSREGCFTFAEGYHRSLQYANWLLSVGAKPKDCIALMSPNTPDFVFLSFAMWAIGCFPGMINYNLAESSLIHCVGVSGAKLMLIEPDEEIVSRVAAKKSDLDQMGVKRIFLSKEVKQQVAASFPDTRPPNSMRDHARGTFPQSLIYTSGTTGLPKAFAFPTARVYIDTYRLMHQTYMIANEKERDVWYDCMPMYHGTGFVTGVEAIMNGMTCAIGRKFSTSRFWQDIHDSGATCFSYVGETARYLLSSPPSSLDRDHKVRIMYGNGLRPDVWERFQERFNIPEVYELFSSTEGMFFVNIHSRSGFGNKTVGHQGLISRRETYDRYIPVKIDRDTNDMWRDPVSGFAKRVPYEQGGEIIVRVPSKKVWSGYWNNPEGSDRKFAADVFEKGDLFYRPGDALRRDSDGFWHFIDRLGDTFRWKGENVSTAELQDVMGVFPGLGEVNVYGVQLPGNEGRAGCAAVVLEGGNTAGSFDWQALTVYLRSKLPRYAVPVFIRVVNADIQAMGTHNNKQNKVLLREEGADPSKIGTRVPHGKDDNIFWLRPSADRYVPLGQAEWNNIVAGKAKI